MDYKEIGLKCGIEIHQQLEGKKLFCNCPTEIKDNEPDSTIKRRLRAVVGETGIIDSAALQEQTRSKEFIYNYYDDCCCLVELDEEPPGPMNLDALKTCFVAAKLLDAKIVDEAQVMRKTVVDGSNTTGFQRTALIAMDGELKANGDEVRIDSICLEEDAAKIVSRAPERDQYNLSRLGIPLVEIATGPDMKSPEQVKIIAEKIGGILRSTDKCKRGLGTIRQDVNVSIKGGSRVEIKGAQDLKTLPLVVEQEAERQKNILKLLNKRVKCSKVFDLTQHFKKSKSKVIKEALAEKGVVYSIKVEGFAGLLGKELQNAKRIGTDLSDFCKIKVGIGGLFHSDELPKYGITSEDVEFVKKTLNCKDKDGFIIIADDPLKAGNALEAVKERLNMLVKGVPKEVRKANADGTTKYLRPMPTEARMYPETDVMPVRMDFNVKLPELSEDKAQRYEKNLGLSKDLASDIAKSSYNQLFEKMLEYDLKPAYIAEVLVSFPSELKRSYEGAEPSLVSSQSLEEIFKAVSENKITKSAVIDIIASVAQGNELNLEKYCLISDAQIEEIVKQVLSENKDATIGTIMGKVMKQLEGKADGKKVSQIVKKYK
ncbi:MAG: Glu-tRNA(Gln) amidotransferase subunit GatE [Nanobdellota archaeon]